MKTEFLGLNNEGWMPIQDTVTQYRGIAGSLNELFKEMGERSEMELWRKDGVGSCKSVDTYYSGIGITGLARSELLRMRYQILEDVAGKSTVSSCGFHRDSVGCIIRDLKSPLCLGFVEEGGEIEDRFHINSVDLEEDIASILEVVLERDEKKAEEFVGAKVDMYEFYDLAMDAVSQMRSYVGKFPIIW